MAQSALQRRLNEPVFAQPEHPLALFLDWSLAPQQDTHAADHFIGAREHRRECRTLRFDSNCAALHSANFVNDIT